MAAAGESDVDAEFTPGGSRIIHGKEPAEGWTAPAEFAPNIEAIEAHLEPFFGTVTSVIHEIVSDRIHLDVLTFEPREGREHWLYVTSGMGDLRMTLPDGLDPADYARAELCIALPAEWGDELRSAAPAAGGSRFWPISLMKWLARYPHAAGTWFGAGHTIPMGEPLGDDTVMDGVLLDHPASWPEAAQSLRLPAGDWLTFIAVYPLHPAEMQLKVDEGTDTLRQRLARNRVSEVLDPRRPDATRVRRLFGLV